MKTKFGLAALDAIQKNYKIILDRLIKGYEKVTGKQPEGIDLTMIKREAYEKAEDSAKVVDMEGKTLDPSKPIMGGKQQLDDFNLSKDDPMGDLEKIIKGEGDTGLPKGPRPFGDNIRDAYKGAGRSREEASEMIEAMDSPGAKKSYEIMEEALGVRLYGDETFEELMKIKETGVHPRGEPPIKKADGGRINFRLGGPTETGGLQNIIGADLIRVSVPDEDSVKAFGKIKEQANVPLIADIQGQRAGLGVVSALKGLGVLGDYLINQGRTKIYNKVIDIAKQQSEQKQLKEAAERAAAARVAAMAANNRALGTGGYQSDFAQDTDFMSGSGTAAEMGSFADGGIATMFVERR